MTFGTAFYLFVLPIAIAAAGVIIAYYGRSDSQHLHPGD